jgi:hypothetical protein
MSLKLLQKLKNQITSPHAKAMRPYIVALVMALTASQADAQTGGVGIGNANPQQKLDVAGAVRLGTTTTAISGSIRFDNGQFEICAVNGVWTPLGAGIVSTVNNGNGTYTFNYSDGSSFTTGNLT